MTPPTNPGNQALREARIDAAARALYKGYENCDDERVALVFNWETQDDPDARAVWRQMVSEMRGWAEAALDAAALANDAQSVPGFVVVPREPTEAMLAAARNAVRTYPAPDHPLEREDRESGIRWKAMIAAAQPEATREEG